MERAAQTAVKHLSCMEWGGNNTDRREMLRVIKEKVIDESGI